MLTRKIFYSNVEGVLSQPLTMICITETLFVIDELNTFASDLLKQPISKNFIYWFTEFIGLQLSVSMLINQGRFFLLLRFDSKHFESLYYRSFHQ